MFAKPASFKPFAAIKGSERKSLFTRIEQQFGVELAAEDRNHLVPKTVQSARAVLHSGTKIQIYSADGQALFLILRDRLVPTVQVLSSSLASARELLPIVWTVPRTLSYLQNGADFMIPGIFGDLPDAKKGSVVQIRSLADGHPVLAVGFALVDLKNLDPEKDKGKAIQVINVAGDTLTPDVKVPEAMDDDEVPASGSGDSTHALAPASAPAAEPKPKSEVEQIQNLNLNDSEGEEAEEDDALSTEEVDEAFEYALRKVFSTPQQYPVPSATVVQMLTENLPFTHSDLVMKKTSWKKIAKLLKWAQKKGWLDVKERQGGEVVVLSSKITDTTAHPPPPAPKKPNKSASSSGSAKMTAQQLYKPRSAARALLPGQVDRLYTAPELRKLLSEWLASQDLVTTGPEVRVNDALRPALGLKQGIAVLSRDEVTQRYLGNCNMFHIITTSGADATPRPQKGPIPTVTLKTERRGGNKVVTLVGGADKFGYDLSKLAERLRVACAGSTSTTTANGMEQVVIQGDHVAKVTKLLENDGLRSSWIRRS